MKRQPLTGQLADPDLKLLRVFKTVVECGGFSAAEVELNIGRSAISRQMADLETRLGMRLCQRGRSGFQLTEHGRLVYDATQELLIDLEKFRSNVNQAHSRLVGELVLSLTDNMITDTNSVIVKVLGEFHQREPEVTINLQVAAPNEVERAVIEGRANLGVAPYHHQLPGLNYQDLHQETSKLYCGANHPLFSMPDSQINMKLLTEYDFIVPGYAHVILLKEHFPELKGSATSYQVEGIATLILSGQYIGFLPEHYAAQWASSGQIRPVLPDSLNYQVPFKVITRKDAQPNLLRTAFLEALCGQPER
ncbi:LysR family transcriptional regulator [Motiliproteus coralliicola]|uniref:LysR family transcriptional regulator n=1 Tax=Motiliproteus coralliicola TaxID=2283196 RepID=A0A369WR45_9GAMM|nr:LysR family transcriptional regulator [Motiliproteus coralliicola]RDE24578.1 LysR family transcriptional regulator [Motiliproteus coralliicola]